MARHISRVAVCLCFKSQQLFFSSFQWTLDSVTLVVIPFFNISTEIFPMAPKQFASPVNSTSSSAWLVAIVRDIFSRQYAEIWTLFFNSRKLENFENLTLIIIIIISRTTTIIRIIIIESFVYCKTDNDTLLHWNPKKGQSKARGYEPVSTRQGQMSMVMGTPIWTGMPGVGSWNWRLCVRN